MPTVFIWSPDSNHRYGHAALQTNKYHISFWPDGDVKNELGVVSTALVGVEGCLIFHPELDRFYEGNRLPTATHHIVNATDEAINGIHEEFLRFNRIVPEDVTLEAAEVLLDEYIQPERSVPITRYTFIAAVERQTFFDAIHRNGGARVPFYHRKQSCVSFCFNIINAADPNPQVHIPISQMMPSPSLTGLGRSVDLIQMFLSPPRQPSGIFKVPWFENYVVEHWVADSKPNKCPIT
jgi:hypothetical protein